MATNENSKTASKWWRTPIIISASFKSQEIPRALCAQQHRIRFSDSVESGILIFPGSGIAFMIVTTQEFLESTEEADFIKKIEKFIQVHRNGFLLVWASFQAKKEWEILAIIQHRFFGSNLHILAVHNIAEVIKGMHTIAKATSKLHIKTLRDQMSLIRNSLMWKIIWDFSWDKKLVLGTPPSLLEPYL